ncbi:GntR family transcriptional regulator [Enterococcus sp. BWB1-3]|uniref:GntR family transcriptional regulator n=1 Tax=unclassified Enterococcus TaxID=2608891 RepID=UPI001920BB5E|nr:GntR family transcriptional regulator [Enterococcus sp. CWB-B31]MBL1229631.1 GntR family transcriptional regulator [Enterococcus sp. BWB1-3]MCB5954185.1 GntR family transcriptional regulator [Enterococcus sp. CWB-B31]
MSKYNVIAEELRSKIVSEEYPVGSVIPPELKLMDSYQVSRHTIRQAIAVLVNEGFLRKEKGSGTYVDDRFKNQNSSEKRTKTIGVITTYLSDYIFPSIIRGIEEELQKKGYSLLLASTNNNPEQEKKCLENMLLQQVDGLIVEPTKSNQYNPNLSYYLSFKEAGIPVVMINAYYEAIDLPSICLDDVKAGFLATSYMLENGINELALIVKMDDLQGKLRMRGFIDAFETYGLTFDSQNIFTYATEEKASITETVASRLLEKQSAVKGVVCYNDEIANLLVQRLIAAGKMIPQDISIIGQDNSTLSTAGEVALTTISHPKEKLGIDAAKWMIKAIETKTLSDSIVYEPEVIERQSVLKKQSY